jgi:hypothetical protein
MFSTLPPSGSGAILRAVDRAAAETRDAQPSGEEAAAGRRSVMRALLAFASAPGSDGDLESSFRALLEDPASACAASSTPGVAARELTVALLRVLPLPVMTFLHETSWRPLVTRLVETQLHELLPDGFSAEQSHVKIQKLVAMQTQCEELLKKALATLTSLDRLKAHRTQLMKALNGGLGKQLLHPFLPHAFVDGHLGEVFARAEAYLESRTSRTSRWSRRFARRRVKPSATRSSTSGGFSSDWNRLHQLSRGLFGSGSRTGPAPSAVPPSSFRIPADTGRRPHRPAPRATARGALRQHRPSAARGASRRYRPSSAPRVA